MQETHTLVLFKEAKRALQDRAVEGNLTAIVASVGNKSLTARGWTIERSSLDAEAGKGWTQECFYQPSGAVERYEYKMHLAVTFTPKQQGMKPGKDDLAAIAKKVFDRSQAAAFGKWSLTEVDGKPYAIAEGAEDQPTLVDGLVGYSDLEIPDDFETNFDHLYGLDAHIHRIKRALEAGIISDWNHRLNVALVGPPGCGKSDICASLKRALGEDAVMEYDATATTSAGAIKDLSEREILPRVIVIEEIEKADEKAFDFLLGILDLRGEIRKTTARATVQRDTKMFAVATVNNYDKFCQVRAGALESRFPTKIGFKRPNREQLAMILKREIDKVQGDEKWIGPTLDYCEDHGITDPRQITAICMAGREELLDGTYQRLMQDTSVENRNQIADWTTAPNEAA